MRLIIGEEYVKLQEAEISHEALSFETNFESEQDALRIKAGLELDNIYVEFDNERKPVFLNQYSRVHMKYLLKQGAFRVKYEIEPITFYL